MAKAPGRVMYPVEELREKFRVPRADHVGTCVKMGWGSGKEVAGEEYAAALEEFRKHPAGRRENA